MHCVVWSLVAYYVMQTLQHVYAHMDVSGRANSTVTSDYSWCDYIS